MGYEKNNHDLRVSKNDRYIKEAFLDLLNKKSYDDITVSLICKKAEINRSTFYLHYSNKDELLDTLYSEILAGYLNIAMAGYQANVNEFRKCIKTAFQYLTKNSSIIDAFLKLDQNLNRKDKKMQSIFYSSLSEYIKKQKIVFKKEDYEPLYTHIYMGFSEEVLHWWLSYGMKENRYDEAAEIILGILGKGMNPTFFKEKVGHKT